MRRARPLAVLALALALAVADLGAGAARAAPAQAEPAVELVAQTPSVQVGGSYVATVRTEGATPGSELQVAVHDRVRSRSELERTFTAEGLRSTVHTDALPLAGAGAGHQVVLDLQPDSPAGGAVRIPGVYPVSIALVDADGARVDRLVTHLVLQPPASPAAPPLDVAAVVRVGAAPRPVDEPPLGESAHQAALALADVVAAAPDVPVTLAPTPDTLAQLAATGGPEGDPLLEALRALAAATPTLALPYVATSPDALAESGLASEVARQLEVGAAVQRSLLGVAPTQATWLAGPDLGAEGLALLDALGVRRVVVAPSQVELVPDGVLTPAGPFEVVPPRQRGRGSSSAGAPALTALATDERLGELLEARRVEPALLAGRVLADLSMLWFERPGNARAVVLPIDETVDGEVVRVLLEGLRAAAIFRPVALDDAFDEAEPLTDRSGDVLRRTLLPTDPTELDDDVVSGITELRSLRSSVEAMVGSQAPVLDQLDAHVLRATAVGLRPRERRRELDDARAALDALAAGVHTPEEAAVTLTAREGRVPLTIANDTGGPVDVRVHLSSPKLELPGGETFAVTLTEPRTRLDIAVRTRASGSFPFDVEVTSPDGRLLLARTTYSVRSTAVSGVGLVLSAGAGLFLIMWWARHWRETRRSAKLVADGPGPGSTTDAR